MGRSARQIHNSSAQFALLSPPARRFHTSRAVKSHTFTIRPDPPRIHHMEDCRAKSKAFWLPPLRCVAVARSAALLAELLAPPPPSPARPARPGRPGDRLVWCCLGDQASSGRPGASEEPVLQGLGPKSWLWSQHVAQTVTNRLLAGSWPAPIDPAPNCL